MTSLPSTASRRLVPRPRRRADDSASTRVGLRLTFIGAVTAAVAAVTLSACGPHDETVAPYTGGGAAAVAPSAVAQSAAPMPEATPVPPRGHPVPAYAPPA